MASNNPLLGSAAATAPDAYTPDHLARRILASRDSLLDERKQVTVVFADIKDSTRLIETMDPEQALNALDPALSAMIEAVHRYEGTVNRVQGDGIMALFGAPIAHEDHAARACYAALAMQESVRKLTDPALEIRVGLHSGEVVVRAINNDLSMDYDAIGPTVHLARRMEESAAPGGINLTVDTLRLAEGFVEVSPLGPMAVKGLRDPIDVFALQKGRSARTPWEVRAARGLSQFVGREEELAAIRDALDKAGTGDRQIVALVGDPGMGKSRLLHEFVASAGNEGWTVLVTGAAPHASGMPYFPVTKLLRSWFKVSEQEERSDVASRIQDSLAAIDKRLLTAVPAVCSLLDLPVTDELWDRQEPDQRRRRIQDAIKDFALVGTGNAPMLVVFEDLQWIDEETQAVLDHLIEGTPEARLLVLLSHRPEYDREWPAAEGYTRLAIEPLDNRVAPQLLQSLLGDDESVGPLKNLLLERTKGTPLFIEETVRALQESEAVEGALGDLRLVQEIDAIEIPATLQSVIAARIDRLRPESKQLLQIASVIGEDVPVALLQQVAEIDEESLTALLGELEDAGLMFEAALHMATAYTFKHGLIHDVAYEGMLLARRRDLHARAVEAIESQHRDRIEEHVAVLAHHAARGEMWDKAVRYCSQAGAKAIAQSAHKDAIRFFERALEALGHLPESKETTEQRIDIRLSLRPAFGATGELQRLYEHLTEAEGLAKAIEDPVRLIAINIQKTHFLNYQGDIEEALSSAHNACEIAEKTGEQKLMIAARFAYGQACLLRGDYEGSIANLTEPSELLKGELRHERFGTTGSSSVACLSTLALAHAFRGDFEEAEAASQDACRIADETELAYDLGFGHFAAGLTALYQGRLKDSIGALEAGLKVSESSGVLFFKPLIGSQIGYAYALAGHAKEGISVLERAMVGSESKHLLPFHAWSTANLGKALLLAGEYEKAEQIGRRAIELAEQYKYREMHVWGYQVIGAASRHDPAVAVDTLRKAIDLAQDLGMRPDLAHCHRGLGEILVASGNIEDGSRELRTALDLYQTMQMSLWIAPTGGALDKIAGGAST